MIDTTVKIADDDRIVAPAGDDPPAEMIGEVPAIPLPIPCELPARALVAPVDLGVEALPEPSQPFAGGEDRAPVDLNELPIRVPGLGGAVVPDERSGGVGLAHDVSKATEGSLACVALRGLPSRRLPAW